MQHSTPPNMVSHFNALSWHARRHRLLVGHHCRQPGWPSRDPAVPSSVHSCQPSFTCSVSPCSMVLREGESPNNLLERSKDQCRKMSFTVVVRTVPYLPRDARHKFTRGQTRRTATSRMIRCRQMVQHISNTNNKEHLDDR
jgi:hypothetical protein